MYYDWKPIIGTALALFLFFDFTPRAHTRQLLGTLSQPEQPAPAPKSE